MRNGSDESCRENQNTHFVLTPFFFFKEIYCTENSARYTRLQNCSTPYFWKSYHWWDYVEKYCRVERATDDSNGTCTLHAGCL